MVFSKWTEWHQISMQQCYFEPLADFFFIFHLGADLSIALLTAMSFLIF